MSSMTHYAAVVPTADILNFGDLSNQVKSVIVLGILAAVAAGIWYGFVKGKIGKVAAIAACVIVAVMMLGLSDIGTAQSFGGKVFAFFFNK